MFHKFLILIGRTFIATYFVVNFFNIIPINLETNSWYAQVSMLLVDTASLLLLGLTCLKFNAVKSAPEGTNISSSQNSNSIDAKFEQDKQNSNLKVINKFSFYIFYFFLLIALLQFFSAINGYGQLNFLHSEKIMQIEKNYVFKKDRIESRQKFQGENNLTKTKNNELNNLLRNKNRFKKELNIKLQKGRFYLFKDNIKILLMSLIWAYGFFKLSRF